jgi:hypothetical protein
MFLGRTYNHEMDLNFHKSILNLKNAYYRRFGMALSMSKCNIFLDSMIVFNSTAYKFTRNATKIPDVFRNL